MQNALRSKLAPKIGEQAKQLFEDKFKVSLPENAVASLTESVGIPYADDQFSQLIEFMSGKRPEECTEEEKKLQNSQAKCLVLIYEGAVAIAKIRSVLGPTDPSRRRRHRPPRFRQQCHGQYRPRLRLARQCRA